MTTKKTVHDEYPDDLGVAILKRNLALTSVFGKGDKHVEAVPMCVGQDCECEASYLMPQSQGEDQPIQWVTVCEDHAQGWFDGGDFDAPVFRLQATN